MTRMHRQAVAAVLVAVLAMGAAACGDDDPEAKPGDPTSASSTSSGPSTPDEPVSESPSAAASPSVTPVAGPELVEETSAIRVPEGWTPAEPLVDYASSMDGPARYDSIQLADRVSLAGPDATIESLAKTALKMMPKGAEVERLPEVDLAGSPAYHLHYTVKGDPVLYDTVATLRNGRSIAISFSFNKNTLAEQPQIIESVLATFRWLD